MKLAMRIFFAFGILRIILWNSLRMRAKSNLCSVCVKSKIIAFAIFNSFVFFLLKLACELY